jgi:hypothetical protein
MAAVLIQSQNGNIFARGGSHCEAGWDLFDSPASTLKGMRSSQGLHMGPDLVCWKREEFGLDLFWLPLNDRMS